jgi:hypothetical protein
VTNRSTATVIEAFLDLRESLAHVLGRQTVDMLIDRSVTEIRAAHPIVRTITVDGDALDLDSLNLAFRDATPEEAQTAMNALIAVMLLVLARLLGKRVAQSLAEQIKRADLFEAVRL